MGTLAAQVTVDGISAPSYEDIFAQLQSTYWQIYGSDADLSPDTQDGQWIAAQAQAIYDCNQLAVAIFNAFSPATAQGVGLSSLVKINGLARLAASNSTAIVTIGGTIGTVIENGIVGDDQNLGTQWTLPETVTIPLTGEIEVTATCTQEGDFTAAAGTLTQILTPTRGWQTVTNAVAASPGNPVETDAALRLRQALSTALPAQAIIESIYASLANIANVGRVQVYENDTDVTDAEGIPSHSIAAVVEDGDVTQIAEAIALKKPPGTGTYGTTEVIIFDSRGVPNTIRFFPLTVVELEIEIQITARPGYVSTTGDQLVQDVVDFINALGIGEDSYTSRLFSPANLGGVGLGATYVVTAILQSRDGDPLDPADIEIAFNEAASCTVANVELVVT